MDSSFNFEDWLIYVAQDIPVQLATEESSNDCGVHVCSWMYSICMQINIEFQADEMNSARSCIATALCNYEEDVNGEFSRRYNRETDNIRFNFSKTIKYGPIQLPQRTDDELRKKNPFGFRNDFHMIQESQ